MKRDEPNIGGNELLLSELIKQANLKKGYVTKAQLMRINLENLTLAALASSSFSAIPEESKRKTRNHSINEVSNIHEPKKNKNNVMETSDSTIQVLD